MKKRSAVIAGICAPLLLAGSAVGVAVVTIEGDPVANERPNPSALGREYCDSSDLPPGEGLANKGNTCVSTPLGEIAAHPVRVAIDGREVTFRNKVKFEITVADNQGDLPLNAFTFDSGGGAGTTLHEHPGELNEAGRPFLHCHLGVVTLGERNGLPGETYDAAFKGVQGVSSPVTATVAGLEPGRYRADVYCSVPGHPQLPTATANQVQAIDTHDFKVIGFGRR